MPEKALNSGAETAKKVTFAEPEKAKQPAKKEAPKPAQRSSEQQSQSFKKVWGYATKECCSIAIGLISMVLALSADLLIPVFIGRVVDYLNEEQYEEIGMLCIGMLGVVIVSLN